MQTESTGELVYYHYPGGPVNDPFVTPRPAQKLRSIQFTACLMTQREVIEQTVMPVAICVSTVQTGA